MYRFLAVLVLLLAFPISARADVGPSPASRCVLLRLDETYPEYVFYLVSNDHVERLPLSRDRDYRVSGRRDDGPYGQCRVYAVPGDVLRSLATPDPPRDWFTSPPPVVARPSEPIDFRQSAAYQVRIEAAEVRLVYDHGIEEPAEWPLIALGVLVLGGLAWFVWWAVRPVLQRPRPAA